MLSSVMIVVRLLISCTSYYYTVYRRLHGMAPEYISGLFYSKS